MRKNRIKEAKAKKGKGVDHSHVLDLKYFTVLVSRAPRLAYLVNAGIMLARFIWMPQDETF